MTKAAISKASQEAVRLKRSLESVSHTAFLLLTGLSKSTAHLWLQNGLGVCKNDDGTWSIVKYLEWLRKKEIDPADDASNKARLERVKYERAQLELDQMRGEIDAEFRQKFEQYCLMVCSVFIAQPKRLALRLANRSAAEVEAELSKYNRLIVGQLAQGEVKVDAAPDAEGTTPALPPLVILQGTAPTGTDAPVPEAAQP